MDNRQSDQYCSQRAKGKLLYKADCFLCFSCHNTGANLGYKVLVSSLCLVPVYRTVVTCSTETGSTVSKSRSRQSNIIANILG